MVFAHAAMSGANVFIDRSQFPENVRRDLLESLHARALNHKFHYESHKQAAKWLALHEAFSPARRDASCLRIYDEAFAQAAATNQDSPLHLVGLGCGGGQKEARLLELLKARGPQIICTLSDVSLPLVLTAREAALPYLNEASCHSIVCDLATTEELGAVLDGISPHLPRLVTLFGIIPNFEPAPLLSRVATLLRPADTLLLSANLAPGPDYATGVQAVLPQYDNALTHDWLLTLLLDLGFESDDGKLRFTIEGDAQSLLRIAAHFELNRARQIQVHGETISFTARDRLRIFFSYRHTPQTISRYLLEQSLTVEAQWLNDAGEEGVFLGRKLR